MLLDHNSVNRASNASGRDRSFKLRLFTTSMKKGQVLCRDCSNRGSFLTSVVLIFSRSNFASFIAGTRAQAGDGLAKEVKSGLRYTGARFLLCSPSWEIHHSTTALIAFEWLLRRYNSVSILPRGLWEKSKQIAQLASNTNSRLWENAYCKQTYFCGIKTKLLEISRIKL